MLSRLYAIAIVSLCCLTPLQAQKVVVQNPVFQTSGQSMWSPSAAPGLNKNFEIFPEYSVNLPFSTASFTKLSFQGLDFGAVLDGHVGFGVGPFEFDISGFTLGEVAVNYPATVRLEMPDDNTFNPGETIVIKSQFQAAPGAALLTTYPEAGTIGLYMGIMFDASLGVQACFIDCSPRLSILPPGDPNLFPSPLVDQRFTFFEVSQNGLIYVCNNTSDPSFITSPFQCEFNTGFPPWTINPGGGAFSGTMDIPNVTTTSSVINNRDLRATGADPYVIPSIDVIELLGYIPPVKAATSIIQGSQRIDIAPDVTGTMRGITIEWALLRVLLNAPIRQSQEFSFEPRIFTTLTFPDTVDYVVHSTRSGNKPGRDVQVVYEVGDSISVRFPCHYDYMDVSAKHTIKNRFSNKTFDNIALELDFDAVDFGLIIDPYTIVPRICIPIPFAGDLCVGPIGFPGLTVDPPPLFDPDPITLVSQDFPPYFHDQWELGGFNEVEITTPFRLKPRERQVNFITQDIACHGDSTGIINVTVPDGATPLQYEWSFGGTAPTALDVPAGNHYIKITDANKCVSFEPVTLTQPPPVTLAIASDSILCHDGVATISASASGGTGPLTYAWSSGEFSPIIPGKPAGSYSVTVTDGAGCSTDSKVTLREPTLLKAKIASAVNPTCADTENGSLILFVEGGTTPYTYQWSNNSSLRDQEQLTPGNYTVTVTDGHGCIATDTHLLTAPSRMNALLAKLSDVNCFSGNNGALQVTVNGGTPPYRYRWYDSLVTLSTTSPVIHNLSQGHYSVEITDSNDCAVVRTQHIDQPARPLQADIIPRPGSCSGQGSGALNLTVQGGTPPYQYHWSTGQTNEDLVNVAPGRYDVTVTDSKGCQYSNKALLVDPEPLRISLLGSNVSCADQQDGSVEIASISGGVEPYQIQWSTGATREFIQDLAEGTYTVTVMDAVGCEVSGSRTIHKNDGDCLNIPNTFSPNGDGMNDTWVIRNIHLYQDAIIKVFNKWGSVVFESAGYPLPWDGTYNGKALEPSTYYYFVDLRNGDPVYKGFLAIVK